MFETEFCKVEYLKKYAGVFCQWKKFCRGDDYRDPLLYGLKLIDENHSKIWITDTTTGFENEDADTRWLIEEFMPKMIESSCEEIIFIMQKNSPLKDEIQAQQKALSEYFKVRIIENLDIIS